MDKILEALLEALRLALQKGDLLQNDIIELESGIAFNHFSTPPNPQTIILSAEEVKKVREEFFPRVREKIRKKGIEPLKECEEQSYIDVAVYLLKNGIEVSRIGIEDKPQIILSVYQKELKRLAEKYRTKKYLSAV